MELVLFEDFLKFPLRLFCLFWFDFQSVSIQRSRKQNLKIILRNVFFWFSVGNVCFIILLSVASKWSNSSVLTFSAPILSSSLLVFKSFAMFLNKSKICGILVDLKKLFPTGKHAQDKFKTRLTLKSFIRFSKIYFLFFLIPCLSVVIIPLVKLVIKGERALVLDVKLPSGDFGWVFEFLIKK